MTDRISCSLFLALTYDDAPAAIEWLCRVFGFEKRLVVPGPGGTVRHSELSFGNGVVMVSSPRSEVERVGPRGHAGSSHAVAVHVPDPDAHHAHARAEGARITDELKDEEHGARGYGALDLEGRPWYFGNYVPGDFWDAD